MTINNKDLYNLYKSVKIDYDNGLYGLYLEGFNGGITAYVTDGKAAYRKTFYGDNTDIFVSYFHKWTEKDGTADLKAGKKDERNFLPKIRAYFENERFNSFTVDGKEFRQAVKAADAINRGGRKHEIALSIHNGKFDIASWNNGDTAFWQLDGDYPGNGAVMVNRRYLDGVKSEKELVFSYSIHDNNTVLHIHGDADAVIMPVKMDTDDQKMFMEVLEYEYKKPEELKLVIVENETVEEMPEPAGVPMSMVRHFERIMRNKKRAKEKRIA